MNLEQDPENVSEPTAATVLAPTGLGLRRRLALAAGAVLTPLVLVGVVAAANGEGTPEPSESSVEGALIAIGGESGDVRDDYENRAEVSGDLGQPGSCPGSACESPALSGALVDLLPAAAGGPFRSAAQTEGEGDDLQEADPDEPVEEQENGTGGPPAFASLPPHENGKGCDDKLFAGGEPPFGGPDGPNFETPVGPCGEDGEGEAADPGRPEDPGAEGRARAADARAKGDEEPSTTDEDGGSPESVKSKLPEQAAGKAGNGKPGG